jgi:hypothetical protein
LGFADKSIIFGSEQYIMSRLAQRKCRKIWKGFGIQNRRNIVCLEKVNRS